MSDPSTVTSRPTVFFDGSCPLCTREIRHYRRLPGAETIRWVDASRDAESLSAAGLSIQTAMRRLHARNPDGDWQVGVEAFFLIWRRLPRYRWLARLLDNRLLRPPLGWAYNRFADWRYRRRCDQSCSVPGGD